MDNTNIENTFTGYLGNNFQEKLVWQVLIDGDFANKIIPLIEISYFDNPNLKKLYLVTLEYFKENQQPCSILNNSIEMAITKYKSNDPIEEETLNEYVKKLKTYNEAVINGTYLNDGEIIQKEALNFVKQQETRKIGESILNAVKNGDIKNKNTFDEIIEKMSKIPDIGNEEDFGSEIFEDIDDALRDNYRDTIPTGIIFLDGIMGSGLGRSEVGLLIAPSGVGKSTLLSKICNTAVNCGKNVLQIIIEDSVSDIKRKHYAIWSGIPLDEFEYRKSELKENLKTFQKENANKIGKLIIKKFSDDNTTIPSIKNWTLNYQKKFGYKFDLIAIDYLDCIMPHKKVYDPNEGELVVMRSFIAMADEMNIVMWSALQTNRGGMTSEIIQSSHSQGNIKRIQKSHFVASFSKPTSEHVQCNIANAFIIKARFAKPGQEIRDIIFNGSTMEIRATNDSWKYGLKEFKKSENEIHAVVSAQISNSPTIADFTLENFGGIDEINTALHLTNYENNVEEKSKEHNNLSPVYNKFLNYLNDDRETKNKSLFKASNDEINEGDGVLIEDENGFNIGLMENGNIKIVKTNINIPDNFKNNQSGLEFRKDPLKLAEELGKNQAIFAPEIKKDWTKK